MNRLGIGWKEISMIMTVFTMVMVWIIVIISVVNKRRGAAMSAPAPSAPLQSQFPTGARLHLAIAALMLPILAICAPLGWLLFGQAGMPLVRLCTIGVLLAALYVVIAAAIAITTSKTPFNQWQIPNPSLGD